MNKFKDKASDLNVEGFIDVMVFDVRKKRVVGRRRFKNVVTDGGRNRIAALTGLAAQTNVQYGAVGSNNATPPAGAQTALLAEFTPVVRKSVTAGALTSANGTVQFAWSFDTSEINGSAVGEIGLFDSSTGGLMFSRATFNATTKDSNMQMNFTYQLRFASA